MPIEFIEESITKFVPVKCFSNDALKWTTGQWIRVFLLEYSTNKIVYIMDTGVNFLQKCNFLGGKTWANHFHSSMKIDKSSRNQLKSLLRVRWHRSNRQTPSQLVTHKDVWLWYMAVLRSLCLYLYQYWSDQYHCALEDFYLYVWEMNL